MTEPTSASGDGVAEATHPESRESPIGSVTGDDWETTVDDLLDDRSFDAELGKETSRDAIRASRGEMSEEEFYDTYHSTVVAEFGVDKRPTPGESDD